MAKDLALIVPYYGTFPEYTKIFFHSLKYNAGLDLILITDQELDVQLENLIVIKKVLKNLKMIFKNYSILKLL